jgi:hypothetical protein
MDVVALKAVRTVHDRIHYSLKPGVFGNGSDILERPGRVKGATSWLKLRDSFACLENGPRDRSLEPFVGDDPLVHSGVPVTPLKAGHADQRSWQMSSGLTSEQQTRRHGQPGSSRARPVFEQPHGVVVTEPFGIVREKVGVEVLFGEPSNPGRLERLAPFVVSEFLRSSAIKLPGLVSNS